MGNVESRKKAVLKHGTFLAINIVRGFVVILSKLVLLLIFPLIALIAWGIFKVFPEGKLKVFLFKVRGRGGSYQTTKEKLLVWAISIVLVVGLYSYLYFMMFK